MASPPTGARRRAKLAWVLLPIALCAALVSFCVNVGVGQVAQQPDRAIAEAETPPARPSHGLLDWAWLPVVLYALAAYLVVNYALPSSLSGDLRLYVVQPVLWGGLAVMSMTFILLRGGASTLYSFRMVFLGSWAAAFQVAALVGVGILYGFGYSPYAHEPEHMAQNGIYLLTLVAGIECARALVISTFYGRSPFLTIAGAALFFAVLMVPAANFEELGTGTEPTLKALVVTIMPALAISVTASYLAAIGGPLPAMIYVGGLLAFEWYSPILPSPEWTVEGFTATFAPLVILLIARAAIAEQTTSTEEVKKFDVSAPWVIATMLIVSLLWFNTGLLGVKPDVVTGSSMEPTYNVGDVVITKPIDTDNVKVGDVVSFVEGQTTDRPPRHRDPGHTHRPRVRDPGRRQQRPGRADRGVSRYRGKVILTVPDVGWVPIKLANALNSLR